MSVAFAGQTKTTKTDADGRWRVALDPLQASAENRDMTFNYGNRQLVFKNVLMGENALHVRMGWAREDVINLTNTEGLTASPLRTDRDNLP